MLNYKGSRYKNHGFARIITSRKEVVIARHLARVGLIVPIDHKRKSVHSVGCVGNAPFCPLASLPISYSENWVENNPQA
jgi:hypothetical protein